MPIFAAIMLLIYATSGVVTETDVVNDVVTIEDYNGNLFQFEGVEDYEEGDIVSCIMYNNNTENITDDVIISCRYSGRIDEM
jgi:hypothetical protein